MPSLRVERLRWWAVCFAAGLSLAACGARTELTFERFDAGAPDAPPPPPPECVIDGDCDDGVDCTVDGCVDGTCTSAASDALCDDGLFCDGVERCDRRRGCQEGSAPCADAIACTEELCDETFDLCGGFIAHPELCPLSHRCDEAVGCVARALVHDGDTLYEIDLPSGRSHVIGPVDVSLTDIALHPDGTTYGITRASLFRVDERNGRVSFVASLGEPSVALDVHPDGGLIAAGSNTVVRVDRVTGAETFIARFPAGYSASGDIAFVNERMFVTGTDTPGTSAGPPDVLFEVSLDSGEVTLVGEVGFPCIWALAPFGSTLYGFTCRGELLDIDLDTGAGRELTELDVVRIGGAAAR